MTNTVHKWSGDLRLDVPILNAPMGGTLAPVSVGLCAEAARLLSQTAKLIVPE